MADYSKLSDEELIQKYREAKARAGQQSAEINRRGGKKADLHEQATEQVKREDAALENTIGPMSQTGRQLYTVRNGLADIAQSVPRLGNMLGMVPDEKIAQYDGDKETADLLEKHTEGGAFFRSLPGLGLTLPFMGGSFMARPASALGQVALDTAIGGGLGFLTSGGKPEHALLGAGLGGAGAVVSRGANFANPKNILARSVQRSEQTPYAQEGKAISQELDVPLTPGQETGNKFLGYLEGAARQSLFTADKVSDFDKYQATKAIAAAQRLEKSLSKRSLGDLTVGDEIRSSYVTAVKQADDLRNTVAGKDYGEVRRIAGDRPVIAWNNFAKELTKIIDENANVAGADAEKVTAQARKTLEKITGGGVGPVADKIDDAMRTRRAYGKAARGQTNIFDQVSRNEDRTLSARLFGAINKDFDEAGGGGSPISDALKKANANYKAYTDSINFMEKSALGRLIGDDLADAAFTGMTANTIPGEKIADRIMKLTPSEVGAATTILKQVNPQLVQDMKGWVVSKALTAALEVSPSQKNTLPISYSKFASQFMGTAKEDQLKAMGWTAKELDDVEKTVRVFLRAGERPGFNYSGTAPMQEAMNAAGVIGTAATGGIGGIAKATISIGGKVFGLNQIAKAMTSDTGRAMVRTISTPSATPQAIAFAATWLTSQGD